MQEIVNLLKMVINASSVMDYGELTGALASICPSQEEDAPKPKSEENNIPESPEQEGDAHE